MDKGIEIGSQVEIELTSGKIIKGKLEKQNPLKIRIDATSTQVIPNGLIKSIEKIDKYAKGTTVKGGGVGKFKVGDKVIIEYINDGNEHNGEIGTITYLNEYNYYPKGDKSVVERKTQGEITYHNGEVEEVSDFYREGSGLVSPIQKVILRKAKEYVNTDLMEKLKKEWQEKNKYEDGGLVGWGGTSESSQDGTLIGGTNAELTSNQYGKGGGVKRTKTAEEIYEEEQQNAMFNSEYGNGGMTSGWCYSIGGL